VTTVVFLLFIISLWSSKFCSLWCFIWVSNFVVLHKTRSTCFPFSKTNRRRTLHFA